VIRKQRLQAMLRGVVQRGTPKRAGGLEPPNIQLGKLTKSCVSNVSGQARSPARSAENAEEASLLRLLDVWPSLPHLMREQIAALAEAACQPPES
jgi:hypothetical protein